MDVTIKELNNFTKKRRERLIAVNSNSNFNLFANSKADESRTIRKKDNCIDTSGDKF